MLSAATIPLAEAWRVKASLSRPKSVPGRSLAGPNLESKIALILNEARAICHAFYNPFGEHGLEGIASGYWTVFAKHSSGPPRSLENN